MSGGPAEPKRPAGIDAQGFIDLGVLEQAANGGQLEEFLSDYPVPGILIELPQERDELDEKDASDAGRLLTVNVRSVDVLRYVGRVGLLCKRPGNPFPRMVSVGRTTTNDLILDVRSISKFHGFFEEQEGVWYFTDHASTNGTWLNGERLAANTKQALQAGDRLQFGVEVEATYLPPAELFARCRATD